LLIDPDKRSVTGIRTINSICVNCGSNPGAKPVFMASAAGLGEGLAARSTTLVYGGARGGLMGAVADSALSGGGKVIGVIPQKIADRVGHPHLTELHVVPSMHERKQMMFNLADAFIVLPGGFGTLEEMFELLTWSQLGMHTKPVALLNIDGYFDPLLKFLESAVANRFVSEPHGDLLLVEQEVEPLLEKIQDHQVILTDKWLDTDLSPNPDSKPT